jgi:GTP cyclohydrolase IA
MKKQLKKQTEPSRLQPIRFNRHPLFESVDLKAVAQLLRFMGEDPNRDGLADTPVRVLKAWREMTYGYDQNPQQILDKDFDADHYDEVIAVPFVEFYSTCEHHLLPFFGFAHVAYLPAEKEPRVVGLSKLARLVDCFARRLQIQERMTIQIADAISEHLNPRGVAVVVQAKHLCMACRGVQKHKASMATSAMRGVFRDSIATREEFFKLIQLAFLSSESK